MSSADLAKVEQFLSSQLAPSGRKNLRNLPREGIGKAAAIALAADKAALEWKRQQQNIAELSATSRDLQTRIARGTDPKQIAADEKELAEAQDAIRAFNEAAEARYKLRPEEKQRLRRVFAVEDFHLANWLNLHATGPFKFAPASYSLKKGQTLREFLDDLREQQEAEEQKIRGFKASRLPLEQRLSAMRKEVEAQAAEGKPDTAPLGVMRLVDNRRRALFKQGSVRWPETTHSMVRGGHHIAFDTDRGVAFTVWALQDQIIARLTKQITEEAASQKCMSIEDRDAAIAEASARILELQRIEERVICDLLEIDGIEVERLPGRHPLALLEIVEVNSAEDFG